MPSCVNLLFSLPREIAMAVRRATRGVRILYEKANRKSHPHMITTTIKQASGIKLQKMMKNRWKFKRNERKIPDDERKTQINSGKAAELLTFRRDTPSRAATATEPSCSGHRMECRRSDTMQRDQTSPRNRSINKRKFKVCKQWEIGGKFKKFSRFHRC